MTPLAVPRSMRLALITLMLVAPTALAAGEALTLSLATEGVLGTSVFNLALDDVPATATRNGAQGAFAWSITSGIVEARYIVDGATSFVPVMLSGGGQGADESAGTLLLDVTGVGTGQGFRTSMRVAGADGTFAGQGSIAHGSTVGTAAGVVTIE